MLNPYFCFQAGTVYVRTYDTEIGSYSNLYAVSQDGMREKLANNIKQMTIRMGHLYYIDYDGTLYTANLSDSSVSDEKKIADGVCDMTVSPDGTAVTYVRDVASDNIGSLYYYTAGLERPVRIEAESFCHASYYPFNKAWFYNFYTSFSNDGNTIYYFTDGSEVEDSGTFTATLMRYNIAENTSTRIGSDILPMLGSEYVGAFPSNNNLWYYKFATYDEEKRIICDLMFWNGETTSVLVNNIIYS